MKIKLNNFYMYLIYYLSQIKPNKALCLYSSLSPNNKILLSVEVLHYGIREKNTQHYGWMAWDTDNPLSSSLKPK